MNTNILRIIVALTTGIVFGLGLAISEMTNPEKVLAFLDVLGNWDPGLLYTMIGAVVVTFIGFRLVSDKPLLDDRFRLPDKLNIDRPLVAGSILFGIGWGIGGYCPGPAITGLGTGATEALIVVTALVAGNRIREFTARSGRG